MAKKRKREDDDNPLKLLELQAGVIQHCQALKAVSNLLSTSKIAAAVARLDSAVAALHALVRGQCVGQSLECPQCGTAQDVVAWVDDGTCDHCGARLELPPVK